MNKPIDLVLEGLEFEYVSQQSLRDNPMLAQLARAIGPNPLDYVHTHERLALGFTMARDKDGKLYARSGQFDLKFHKRFRECGHKEQK